MKMNVCYVFVACLAHLTRVTFANQPKIDLLVSAGLTKSAKLPSGVVLLEGDAGYTGLDTPVFYLTDGRTSEISFSSSAAQDIGNSLTLGLNNKLLSFYTMLRLDVIKARNPNFSQTQTLVAVVDGQNSNTYFKIGLKVKAKQTRACFTCVEINLVVNYRVQGGQVQEAVFDDDYSRELNNGQWHNLFIGFVYDVAGSDTSKASTEIFLKIDCISKAQKSIGNSLITVPSSPKVVVGGVGDEVVRGSVQDFYFVKAAYLSIESEALAKYCRENSCGVDCKDSVAPLEAELNSLLASNDQLGNDITSCENKPILGPTTEPGCSPLQEKRNGDGTCDKCTCSVEGQRKCFTYQCS